MRDLGSTDIDFLVVRENNGGEYNGGEYSDIGGRIHAGTEHEAASPTPAARSGPAR